jgi:hypothetical protein|tara:strand:+ start:101 stop:841 length:741 start_codon:yes stop_codon:yes gene_type:complete
MIYTPVIHDRFIVKEAFNQLIEHGGYKNTFSKPDNLTILTVRNQGSLRDRIVPSLAGYEDKSILEVNLEYLGIQPLVILTDSRLPWRNTFKFETILKYLNSGECNTEYFMFCDAVDVIFRDDPQKVIDIFKTFNCEALFMSTHSTDGYTCMPEVKRFIDESIQSNERYLNSGVYIGKTTFIKELFEEAIKFATPHGVTMDDYHNYLGSKPLNYPHGAQDQDIIRYLEPNFYPRLKVDYKNKMAYRH